ncbi:hypothetical protein [Egicoccus halophilus]|uniref:Uncharacterized protein n=1 Tax=Egicoccus halophilus TaxID=1670830 RepID=A0A8J3EVD4_9ACTN|nr:hypothetical protein [Egicoccus halophilus]GGI07896.1 hypothetical protein GCM10011354_26370 [Egicoccus halophilus]
MNEEASEAPTLEEAVQRIAIYAERMTQHHERQGFGEARSWRVVVHEARRALGLDPVLTAPAGEPLERRPDNDELERLIRRSRLVRQGSTDLALDPLDAHGLLGQLAAELLLWRHSHPTDLPG